MSKDCPLQTKVVEIKEARCVTPLLLRKKGGSWFCEYYDNEENCPVVKELRIRWKEKLKEKEGK